MMVLDFLKIWEFRWNIYITKTGSSLRSSDNTKSGLGLGIFIGKTLLEKNYGKVLFRNSETRGGAEIKIEWLNKNLSKI